MNTVTCSILSRRALELSVKWLYANDNDLTIPYQDNLSALVHDITFKNIIDEKLLKQIEYIIKLGNFALNSAFSFLVSSRFLSFFSNSSYRLSLSFTAKIFILCSFIVLLFLILLFFYFVISF